MSEKNKDSLKQVEGIDCSEHCLIGLDECVECGACDICSDGAVIKEEELPPHWQLFIEKSKRYP